MNIPFTNTFLIACVLIGVALLSALIGLIPIALIAGVPGALLLIKDIYDHQ